jgi:hypothetical protein
MPKAMAKVDEVFSPYKTATKIGGNMVRLKIISSSPSILAMILRCISGYALNGLVALDGLDSLDNLEK